MSFTVMGFGSWQHMWNDDPRDVLTVLMFDQTAQHQHELLFIKRSWRFCPQLLNHEDLLLSFVFCLINLFFPALGPTLAILCKAAYLGEHHYIQNIFGAWTVEIHSEDITMGSKTNTEIQNYWNEDSISWNAESWMEKARVTLWETN